MTLGAAKKMVEETMQGVGALKGADGLSAYQIAVNNGFSSTETEWLNSLKGEKGEPGKDGSNGVDGYTPIKGIDYWTEEDKTEIKQYVDNQIGGTLNGSY